MHSNLIRWIQVICLGVLCTLGQVNCAFAQQNDLDKKVSVKFKEKSVKVILETLRTDHQLNFAYSDNAIRAERTITVVMKKVTLREVLNKVCAEASLQYEVSGDRIVISPVKTRPRLKKKVTVSGYVTDAETGEKLIGANIAHLGTWTGVTTNPYGFYSLTFQSGETELACSFIGYERRLLKWDMQNDTSVNIALQPSVLLKEVEIEGSLEEDLVQSSQMSTIDVSVRELAYQPSLTGETDVLRSLQNYPGVNFGDEGTVSFYVRGGSPDQNLIMLDGVPIYNTYHLFGLVSIFNSSAINNAKLVKGGYPARYGGRLASVFDVHMREGNMKKFHGEASVSLLTAKVSLEGPIKPDTTSFFLAVRRTYADLIVTPIMKKVNANRGIDGTWSFNFYDLNAKVNHKFSDRDRVYFSIYNSVDNGLDKHSETVENDSSKTVTDDNYDIAWSNFTSSLRWNHVYGKKLFSNTTLLFSDYHFDIKEKLLERVKFFTAQDSNAIDTTYLLETFYNSDIRDVGARLDFHWFPSPKHNIRFGGNTLYHTYIPGVYGLTSPDQTEPSFDTLKITAWEYNAYLEDEFQIGKRMKFNLGGRASLFQLQDTFYYSLEPRASVRTLIGDHFALKGSYAEMTQYIHLLNNAQVGFPVDLWVPVTNRISPQRSRQVAVGFSCNLPWDLEFSMEAYRRDMDSVIEYENGASFLTPLDNWQDKVIVGSGFAHGIEFFLRKGEGKTKGWISYTLSKSRRKFVLDGELDSFNFRYDHPHDISLTLNHQLKKNIFISASWNYHTGSPFTFAEAAFPLPGGGTGITYSKRNSLRMRDYHRLDLGVSFVKEKKWGTRIVNINLYNAYNRQNPFFVYLREDEVNPQQFDAIEVSYFPIIPSFSYTLRF